MLPNNAHHQRCVCLSAKILVRQALIGLTAEEAKLKPCKAKQKLQRVITALEAQEAALQECVTAGNDYFAEEVTPDASTDGQ